jgi:spore coat protein U-like protein
MKSAKNILSTLSAAVLGIAMLCLATAPAQAATATTTFGVSATVQATCSVVATAMSFGTYIPTAASTSTSTVTATCTTGATPTFTLSAGLGTGATVTNRLMMNGGILLGYGLYSDAAHTQNFGTTATTMTSGTAVTIYGQVPAGQYVTPNLYSDTITVTVSY